MSSADPLHPIRQALKVGDKATAQTLLRPLLKDHPTADVWFLAAQACTTSLKAISCLHRALAIEPQHREAKRLLAKLDSAAQDFPSEMPPAWDQPPLEALTAEIPLKPVRRKHRTRRVIILLSLLLFGVSCSLITMNMVGVISGPITVVTQLMGGATPVREIDGVPLSDVPDAPLLVLPAQTKPLEGRAADVLEPGYAHDYTFAGQRGKDVAIYVQFLSVAAKRVSRNVVVLRPDDSDATPGCLRDSILQGDNNVTLLCGIDAGGTWKVRILGRAGESVGAYFVGVQAL